MTWSPLYLIRSLP